MKLKFKLGISQRIFLSFFGLIGLFSLLSVLCYQIMINSKQSANYMSEVVDPSLKAMDDFELMVVESKMLTTNWVFLRSKTDDKEALHKLQNERFFAMRFRMDSLTSRWNDKPLADSLNKLVTDFGTLIRQQKSIMGMLVKFEDYDDPMLKLDAESTLEEKILPQTAEITTRLNKLISNKKIQKAELVQEIENLSEKLRNTVMLLLLVFIIVSLVLGFYMSNIITKPIITVKNGINALGLGKLNEIDLNANRSDEIGEMIHSVNHLVTNLRSTTEFANNIGKGNFAVDYTPLSEHDVLGKALIDMKVNLTKFTAEERDRNWVNHGMNEVGEILRRNHDGIAKLTEDVLTYIINYTGGLQGAIYRLDVTNPSKPHLALITSHGLLEVQKSIKTIDLGEGIIGQVAVDKQPRVLSSVDGLDVTYTGINQIKPKQIVIMPLVFEDEILGVLEISTVEIFSTLKIEWVHSIANMTAATCDSILRKQTTEYLLKEARKLNTELLTKEDALRHANQKMQEKTIMLEEQNEAVRTKNESLEIAREAIKVKADELERANLYKSEFLANMSHELRTPLNSILILSNLLAENKDQNLTNKQVDYSRVIQKSGSDLLSLINDILDLSKIESKHMEVEHNKIDLADWVNDIKMLFAQVAENKDIDFVVEIDENVPQSIYSDPMRLSQILKNLLSNAFKFTDANGTVSLRLHNAPNAKVESICLEVADSGIGIPYEKQQLIFEPFRQADGSTSRKFGGTGLGLSISRELSILLGGQMTVESTPGIGSTFTLFIPTGIINENEGPSLWENTNRPEIPMFAPNITSVEVPQQIPAVIRAVDDSSTESASTLNLAAYKILIVDDDMRNIYSLSSILDEYKPTIVMANNGQEAIDMLNEHADIDLVLMDIMMPIMDGYQAMRKIRKDLKLTHLPIIAVTASAMMGDDEICMAAGANDYMSKPVSKKLLINCITKWLNLDKAMAV